MTSLPASADPLTVGWLIVPRPVVVTVPAAEAFTEAAAAILRSENNQCGDGNSTDYSSSRPRCLEILLCMFGAVIDFTCVRAASKRKSTRKNGCTDTRTHSDLSIYI